MNFFDLKRLLACNQYLFRFSKWCYNQVKGFITYPKRKRKAKLKASEIRQAHEVNSLVIWYFCVATHYNLGDLAQTICTLDWLKENYSDHLVVELSS